MAEELEEKQRGMALRHLVHSQGWRAGVLAHLLKRLAQWDHVAVQVQLEPSTRLDAIGRKQELLDLVQWVYQQAEEPNPFQVARGALYTALVPKQEAPPPAPSAEAPALRQRRLPGGSVA